MVVAVVVGLVDLVSKGVLWLGTVLIAEAAVVVGVEAPLNDCIVATAGSVTEVVNGGGRVGCAGASCGGSSMGGGVFTISGANGVMGVELLAVGG